MKYVNILSFAAIIALAFSCNKDEYPEYSKGPADASEGKTEVYFPVTSHNVELEPTAETFEITVKRTDAASAISVPLIVNNPSTLFDIPEKVEFAAGEEEATLVVGISRLELETVYEFSVSIPIEFYYAYKVSDYSDSITYHFSGLKQKWNDAGTCVFYDGTWFDDIVSAENVSIQNHEGTDDYRIITPYALISPEDFDPVNITFSIKDNEVVFKNGTYNFWSGTGYYFYWDADNYGAYCYVEYSKEGDDVVVEVNSLVRQGSSLYTGGYFAFVWTGGPLVVEDEPAE